jgi:hypothetical protein
MQPFEALQPRTDRDARRRAIAELLIARARRLAQVFPLPVAPDAPWADRIRG